MADERIEDIAGGELTAPAPGDLYVILDASDTTDDPQGTVKNIKHQTVAAGLSVGATKTGSFTAAVGELYPISMASLGANIDVTFPSTPAAGDTFGFYVAIQNTTDTASSGFPAAPFWGVEPVATTSINGTSYTQASGDGLGKWGLLLNGELLMFRYDAVASTWLVIQNGKLSNQCKMRLTSNQTGIVSGVVTKIDVNSVDTQNAGCGDTTNKRIHIKREAAYLVSGKVVWFNLSAAATRTRSTVKQNGTTTLPSGGEVPNHGSGGYPSPEASEIGDLNAGDYLELNAYHTCGSNQSTTGAASGGACVLWIKEEA